MNTDQGRSTGARNIFEAYPLGTIEGSRDGESTVLVLEPRYRRGLVGLDRFDKVLVVYHKDGALRIEAVHLKGMAENKVYLERLKGMEGGVLLDIKPFFRELDE